MSHSRIVRFTAFSTLVLAWIVCQAQTPGVDLSTGQLAFSKKLLTVKGHSLSFDVNLNYNSRVTKHQLPSWVGFGFDLDMPYIERKVKGFPDEKAGHSKYSWDNVSGLHDLYAPHDPAKHYSPVLLFDYYVYSAYTGGAWSTPSSSPCTTPITANGFCLAEQEFDVNCPHLDNVTQQDVYSLSGLPAGSGRIFFGMDGKRNITPYRPWIIACTFTGPANDRDITSWTITDEDGVTYTFSDYVKSTSYNGLPPNYGVFDNAKITYQTRTPAYGDPDQSHSRQLSTVLEKNEYTSPYVKRWYLSSMVSHDGDRIDFSYHSGGPVNIPDDPYFSDINRFESNGEIIVQGILLDKSEALVQTLTPSGIQTDLQTVTFATASDGSIYDGGRDKLTSITLTDKASNASLETVTFSQQKGASGLYGGRLRLNEVYLTKHTQSDTRKRLYRFGYTPVDDLGDYFGSVDGVVNEIEDVNGGVTSYGYSLASFGRLSDGSAVDYVPFGQVVTSVSQAGGFGAPGVDTYIEYDVGEANYGSALSGTGLAGALAILQYGDPGSLSTNRDMCLDYDVHYGRVTTSSPGQGKTVYSYYTSSDFLPVVGVANGKYQLKDDANEYNLNSNYRNRLHTVGQYAQGAATSLKMTTYTYYAKDFHQNDGSGSYHYEKPQTNGQHFLFVYDAATARWCVGNLSDPIFNVQQQFGLPAAEIARLVGVNLGQEDVTYMGVTKTTEYYYEAPGNLMSKQIEHLSPSIRRATILTHACQKYPAYFTAARNLLSPVAVTETQYWDVGSTPLINATVKARIDCWGDFGGTYYPNESYTWCEQHQDASGLPTPVFDLGEFNFSTNTGSSRWLVGEAVITRNSKGYAQDVLFTPDNLWRTAVYRNDRYLTIGQVTRARSEGVGVYTCDYDVTPADPAYLDQANGWEQGGALLVVPPADKKHFGEKVVQVNGVFGPTKNITTYVDPSRDYIFSAWVYPLNGNPMRLVVEPHPLRASAPNFDSPSTGLIQNQWQQVTKRISGAELRARGLSGHVEDYLRIWIGCYPSDANKPNFYVDDIRFYPADALVTTTYFDWRGNVICTVDANDKPKFFTYDGWDRVNSRKNSKGQVIETFDYHLQGDLP